MAPLLIIPLIAGMLLFWIICDWLADLWRNDWRGALPITLVLLAAIVTIIFLTGCKTSGPPPADAGSAAYSRVTETGVDGRTKVTETMTFTTPQNDAKGSGFAIHGRDLPFDVTAHFGGVWMPATPPSAGSQWGQRALYGSGIASFLLAGAFIGIGRHFKLAKVSAGTGLIFFGLAVTVDRYPLLMVLGIGALTVLIAAFVGWQMWKDYKEQNSPKE